LALTGVGTLTAGPHLRKMPYDPMALSHITRLVRMPFIVAVRNDLPAKTLPEFMELARKTEIRWASGGIGTSQHLSGELFAQMSGLKMVHVPYRGTGPALNDLAGGVVDAYFGDPPTLGEAVPGYEAWNWYGLDAPPKTPDAIVDQLAATVRKVLADPAVKKKY